MNEFFGSMINMDDPKHFRLRSIVSPPSMPDPRGPLLFGDSWRGAISL